jgi:ATP-dependent helicase HepA
LIEQRLTKLTSYYQRRIATVNEEISKTSNEKIRRMKNSMLDRLERELKQKREQLEQKKSADIISQRIAHGMLVIK